MNLQQAVQKLVKQHGTQAAAARVAQISTVYLHHMFHGRQKSASSLVLRRLGLRMSKTFQFTRH